MYSNDNQGKNENLYNMNNTDINFSLSLVPILSAGLTHKSQKIGSKFSMFCNLEEGSLPVFFEWSKNGQTLKGSPDVNYKIDNFESHSTLTIRNIDMKDVANYTCFVSNQFGSNSRSTLLSINGKSLLIS